MARKGKKKSTSSIWKSKEAKRAYWLLGLPCFLLLVWYAYTVIFEFNKPAMSRMEANLKAGIVDLAERALREGFRTEHVDACRNMIDEYTTPKGWFYSDAELYQLVGLESDATDEEISERCIFFARVVSKMRKTSLHDRHVFVCGGSIFDLGHNGTFYLKADPVGRGVLAKFTQHGEEKLITVPKDGSAILQHWQIYNVGDGCIIVGLSKAGVFRMSGQVDYEEQEKP